MESPRYYFPMKVQKWASLEVFGMELRSPMSNCIGFIPVFNNEFAAKKEFQDCEIVAVEATTLTAAIAAADGGEK